MIARISAWTSVLLVAAACGSRAPATTATTTATAAPWLDLVGHWRSADGSASETWVDVSGGDESARMIGVGFTGKTKTTMFEVLLIHRDNGRVVYTAMPRGTKSVDFALAAEANALVFANPTHDHPQRIRYRIAGDALHIALDGAEGKSAYELRRAPRPGAKALEALDTAFAKDSSQRGGAAWAAVFEAQGATWPRGSKRVVGPTALAAEIDGLRSKGADLLWTPSTSGLAPAGDMAFTVGSYRVVRAARTISAGNYVSVWRRDSAGAWKISFDSGLPKPAAR